MTNPLIFTSCDSVYFEKFAGALVHSCWNFDQRVHVHIINPTIDTIILAEQLTTRCGGIGNRISSFSVEFDAAVETLTGDPLRTLYASNRFFAARTWLRNNHNEKLIIIDVDSYLNKAVSIPECFVGLYFRDPLPGTGEWEREGSRVAAGVVYVTGMIGLEYLESTCKRIVEHKGKWFVDQWALYKTYIDRVEFLKHVEQDFPWFEDLSKYKILDWKFEDDTMIWTGKGPRKYENEKYVKRMNELSTWESRND